MFKIKIFLYPPPSEFAAEFNVFDTCCIQRGKGRFLIPRHSLARTWSLNIRTFSWNWSGIVLLHICSTVASIAFCCCCLWNLKHAARFIYRSMNYSCLHRYLNSVCVALSSPLVLFWIGLHFLKKHLRKKFTCILSFNAVAKHAYFHCNVIKKDPEITTVLLKIHFIDYLHNFCN